MTNPEAKELTLEVWTYLAEHPEVNTKLNLPMKLYNKIKDLTGDCPLCELFFMGMYNCTACPLNTKLTNCNVKGSPFSKWVKVNNNNQQRKEAATEIVNIVKAWEV